MTVYQPVSFSPNALLTASNWRTNSLADIIGRRFPHRVETSFGSSAIHPYVVPWPNASDAFGVAWPSGTVGVAMTRTPLAEYSDADILSALQDVCRPVPGVLPSGYTARMARDIYFSASAAGCANLHTSGPGFTDSYYRDDNGFVATQWRPTTVTGSTTQTETSGQETVIANKIDIGGGWHPGYTALIRSGSPGWRKLQMRISSNSGGTTHPLSVGAVISGSATFNISHNADGSANPQTSGVPGVDCDTVDATVTFTGFVAEGTVYVSPWEDLGEILSTTGVPSRFYCRCTTSSVEYDNTFLGTPVNVGPWTMQLRESVRADIPFVFTATGLDDLIAPGGIVS